MAAVLETGAFVKIVSVIPTQAFNPDSHFQGTVIYINSIILLILRTYQYKIIVLPFSNIFFYITPRGSNGMMEPLIDCASPHYACSVTSSCVAVLNISVD